MISDLLDVSRIEAGRFEIQPSVFDVHAILRSSMDELRTVAASHGTEIVEGIPSVRTEVACDLDRMSQVLSNVVGNAIKFIPGGVGKVTIEVSSDREEVIFSVADNGPGISPEELPHVFDRYWHGKRTRKSGAGLGLSIARGIVEAHQGRIWVESRPNEGARIYFAVPSAKSAKGKALFARSASR